MSLALPSPGHQLTRPAGGGVHDCWVLKDTSSSISHWVRRFRVRLRELPLRPKPENVINLWAGLLSAEIGKDRLVPPMLIWALAGRDTPPLLELSTWMVTELI